MNLGNFPDNAAEKYPDKTAVICGNKKAIYHELKSRVEKLAAALYSLGIIKGSKAGIIAFNSIEYIEAIFALMKLGAVCVPLNHRLTQGEIKELAEHAEIGTLFFENALAGKVPFDLPKIKNFISFDAGSGYVGYESLVSDSFFPSHSININEQDEAFIIYTSGTTGKPRGVMLTHGNLISNAGNYSEAYGMTHDDIELAPTPLFHASTLGRVFTYVSNCTAFILCRRFSPESCLDLIEKERVTSITQAPTMYQMMLNVSMSGDWDRSSVRRVVTGASPMSVKAKRQLRQLFPKAEFFDLYGLTEASPGVTILKPPDFNQKIESVGKPMKGVEVSIRDENGKTVPAGNVGEIYCRGQNVMKGYYKEPGATAETLRDGWLCTGDMGRMDDEGFVYMAGRKKEIIISGGENIYPGEIEKIILEHPCVEETAVTGIPDEVWGERVTAVVVLKKGIKCTEESILEFCRKHLAGFKCPRAVFFTDILSKNASNKVSKKELQKLCEKQATGCRISQPG